MLLQYFSEKGEICSIWSLVSPRDKIWDVGPFLFFLFFFGYNLFAYHDDQNRLKIRPLMIFYNTTKLERIYYPGLPSPRGEHVVLQSEHPTITVANING